MINIKCYECGEIHIFSEKLTFCSCGRKLFDSRRTIPKIKYKIRLSKVEQMMESQKWTKGQAEDWLSRRDGMIQ